MIHVHNISHITEGISLVLTNALLIFVTLFRFYRLIFFTQNAAFHTLSANVDTWKKDFSLPDKSLLSSCENELKACKQELKEFPITKVTSPILKDTTMFLDGLVSDSKKKVILFL